MEKVKKRYRKKKTKLEEEFPSYLQVILKIFTTNVNQKVQLFSLTSCLSLEQEAFFGRDLLDRSRLVEKKVSAETTSGSQLSAPMGLIKTSTTAVHGPSPSGLVSMVANRKQGTLRKFFIYFLDPSSSSSSTSWTHFHCVWFTLCVCVNVFEQQCRRIWWICLMSSAVTLIS